MSKLDIRKDLSERTYRTPNPFLYWIYRTVMKIVGRKYHPHFEIVDPITACDGPCFVIFNHLSRIDHMYVMEACYPRRVNILAGYSEFFRSHLHFAFRLNRVLPKKQYTEEIASTKAILSIIRRGGCVAFAPEGLASNDGTPKPIVPHTGYLFKKLKVPVYFVELRGQYLQNTKVCLDERYGETFAKLSLLFSKEDLERLSGDEIDARINEAFRHDEYAWQKEKKIRWDMRGRPCYRLNDLLYRCPKCGGEFTMKATDTEIRCTVCGNGATMDDFYALHPLGEDAVIPETPTEWVSQERVALIRAIRSDPDYRFTEHVKIGKLPNDHYLKNKKTSEIVGKGMLTVDHSGMHYRGDAGNEHDFDLDYSKLFTLVTELDSSYFNLYVNGEYHDVFPERPCAIMLTMLVEEMHRLHVNFYKNFPWNEYMYRTEEQDGATSEG